MSHFIKCDRCGAKENTLSAIGLPPGWQKILGADLCEFCCKLLSDFIYFKPSDAAALPVEPIPEGAIKEELFDVSPEPKEGEQATS